MTEDLRTDWRPYEGDIVQCAAPEAGGGKWKFRQLFFNRERQIRPRYPNFDPKDPLYGGWAFSPFPWSGSAFEGSGRRDPRELGGQDLWIVCVTE